MNSSFQSPFVFGIQGNDGIGTCVVLVFVRWVEVSRVLARHVCARGSPLLGDSALEQL